MFLSKIFLNVLCTCPQYSIQLLHRIELYAAMCPTCNDIFNTDVLRLKTVGNTCCLIEILYLEWPACPFVCAFVLNFPQYGLSLSALLVRLFLHINGRKFCSKMGRKKKKRRTIRWLANWIYVQDFMARWTLATVKMINLNFVVLSHILAKCTCGSRRP